MDEVIFLGDLFDLPFASVKDEVAPRLLEIGKHLSRLEAAPPPV